MTEREHAPYHERRLEQQMLDALLRIEEILRFAHPDNRVTGEDEEFISTPPAELIEKGFSKPKAKRK